TVKRNEAQIRSLLDALPAAVAMLDEHGIVAAANAGWHTFAGHTQLREEPIGIGTNYLAFVEDAGAQHRDAAAYAYRLRNILGGGVERFEQDYSVTLDDGQQQWYRLLVAPMEPEMGRGAVVLYVDVTL